MNAIMDCLVVPLQEKLEDWKKTVVNLDKDHAKGERALSFLVAFSMAQDKQDTLRHWCNVSLTSDVNRLHLSRQSSRELTILPLLHTMSAPFRGVPRVNWRLVESGGDEAELCKEEGCTHNSFFLNTASYYPFGGREGVCAYFSGSGLPSPNGLKPTGAASDAIEFQVDDA
uniref:(California timema) hypothetical protein n=1 Tax=Timema californicum TaxID=61474 RepID=A0A7R9J013_TIMCA|nr:unnamed protein product [Timema californicum]